MNRVTRTASVLTALAVLFLGASPAYAEQADAEGARTEPADGSVVPGAPPVVTLRLPHPAERVTAVVTDGCGQAVPSDVRIADRRVSVRLAVSHTAAGHTAHTTAGGLWRVRWHATGTDGRIGTGTLGFTVGVPADCAPAVVAPLDSEQPPLLYATAAFVLLSFCARFALQGDR